MACNSKIACMLIFRKYTELPLKWHHSYFPATIWWFKSPGCGVEKYHGGDDTQS